jgi:ammonia channel protein AmtB
LHNWVERRFKLDDAVGAVAVHGYGGFIGTIIAGFVLWGYPSSPTEGYPIVNPLGNFIGAIIMFVVLGFIPGYGVSYILKKMNLLRIPEEVELAGLDYVPDIEAEEQARELIGVELGYINGSGRKGAEQTKEALT